MPTTSQLRRTGIAAALTAALLSPAAHAAPTATTLSADTADKDIASSSTHLGKQTKVQFRVGAEITATRGACRNIIAMVTVPLECPEQHVTIISEDFSPEVHDVTYRPLPGGEVRQMLISIPRLADGATAHAILTVEVT